MSGPTAPKIEPLPQLEHVLKAMANAPSNPHRLVVRAQIVLLAAAGESNAQIGRRLGLTPDTARKWRKRWLAAAERLAAVAEGGKEKEIPSLVEAVLPDAPRSGRPDTFSPEQLVAIVAVTCEDPHQSGREISHWTNRELADEVIQRKIVEKISPRHVGRILEEADLKPHLSRYWLNNERDQDPTAFDAAVKAICGLYLEAPALARTGHPRHQPG